MKAPTKRILVTLSMLISMGLSTGADALAFAGPAGFPTQTLATQTATANLSELPIKALNLLVSKSPANADYRRYYCFALLKESNFAAAADQLKIINQLSQPNALDSYLHGELALNAKSIKVAEQDFKQALSQDPQLGAARSGLIRTLVAKGDYDFAEQLCRDCIEHPSATVPAAYFKALAAVIAESRQPAVQNPVQPVTTEMALVKTSTQGSIRFVPMSVPIQAPAPAPPPPPPSPVALRAKA